VTQNAHLLPPDELGSEDTPLPRVLRETPGLVLIDELDVHLHPRWQRRVATDLKTTFPGIQFICTSHSPQVIGEVEKESIRIYDPKTNIWGMPSQSFGMDSNWILNVLMTSTDTDKDVKQGIENAILHATKKDLIAAQEQLAQLRQKVGNSEKLQFLASTIERIKLLGK
jgi:predicted ATP-binding protein involved in virulence